MGELSSNGITFDGERLREEIAAVMNDQIGKDTITRKEEKYPKKT